MLLKLLEELRQHRVRSSSIISHPFGGGFGSMSGNKDDDEKNGQKMTGPLVCVKCGKFVPSVYIEYSPGNIRLSNCANCEGIVDKYVEYEIMALDLIVGFKQIVIIDVVLHKYEAYRHVFFNYPRLNELNLQALVGKVALCSLFLDTWRWTSPGDGKVKVIEWDSPNRFFITTGKVLLQVVFLNCVYLFGIMITLNKLSKTRYNMKSKYQDIFLAVLFSSHFKFFVFAMMVWEFSFIMGLMVDLLMLTSNTVALEVMLNASRFDAASAVVSGAICKCVMVAVLRYNWFFLWG